MSSATDNSTGNHSFQSLLESSLECSLCLNMVCEPLSISCGHTFCRPCLVKSLRRHKKKCPSCRAICHVSPETAEENVMIKTMAMTLNPDGYAARVIEIAAEKADWSKVYPIFYYNEPLYPGSNLSLHLFEPRYRIMMQRVSQTTRSFAYVPNFVNYHATVGDIALLAQVHELQFLAGF